MLRILVAIDGSPAASAAIDVALDLARGAAATVLFAHVLEPARNPVVDLPEGDTVRTVIDALRSGGTRLLEEAQRRAQAAGVAAEAVLAEGNVAHELLQIAQREGVGLIVCGSHGRGPLTRLLLGSVSSKLVHLSPVPVTVVPSPERAQQS